MYKNDINHGQEINKVVSARCLAVYPIQVGAFVGVLRVCPCGGLRQVNRGNARACGLRRVSEVELPVLGELRVECQPQQTLLAALANHVSRNIDERLGLNAPVLHDANAAALFHHIETRRVARCAGYEGGPLETAHDFRERDVEPPDDRRRRRVVVLGHVVGVCAASTRAGSTAAVTGARGYEQKGEDQEPGEPHHRHSLPRGGVSARKYLPHSKQAY